MINNENDTVTLMAVGDVGPHRDDPASIFEYAGPVIRRADIRFCQLERIFSSRGAPEVSIRSHHSRVDPKNVSALTAAGFQVVSFASNHSLDWGPVAFLDTLDLLRKEGMLPLGAGKDIDEARSPVLVEKKGAKVAFLGYCTVLPKGYDAAPSIPGCAPLRAKTFYEQIDWQAGTPPRIITFTEERDLKAMVDDVKKARAAADVVIVSIHWGVHFAPAIIAMYQREVGHAAIDAGADAIVGHHAHILKPIEVYRGKPIFYSLCNFAFEQELPPETIRSARFQEMLALSPGWVLDGTYKSYPFPPDSRMTMAAKLTISGRKVTRVSFLPAFIEEDSRPRFLTREEGRFGDVIAYLGKIGKSQHIETQFTIEGDEVVVGT